jgi:hypothetical protein
MPMHRWPSEGHTMNEHAGLTGDERGVAGPGPGSRHRWRTIVAVLLIVIGCVLAPLAGVAVWARNQVTNTDRYVRTVAPLAADPAIQAAVADQITTQIFTYLDVQGLTNQAVDALAEQGLRPQLADRLRGLAGPLASGIQSFVRTEVAKIVQSQAFADAWTQANRVAHQALVKALTGQGDRAVTVANDTVSVNLAPFIQTVKQRLVDSGFDLAARSLRSTPPSSCSTSRISPAHRPRSTCSTPWGSGCRSLPSCCSGSGSLWPRTTGGPWSAPPSGSRWACWGWACRWRCSGPSTWTPSRPRCCPMTPPRRPTTPSCGTCAWGCARCWCWPWSSPAGRW